MPSFVAKTNVNLIGPLSSAQITYTPTIGNSLIMSITLVTGTASVSEIFDDQGNDIFGNPINAWQNLGTINLGTTRLELWGVLNIKQAPAKTTILLTNSQSNLVASLEEYSGVSSFGLSGTVSNTGYSDLFFQGTASNNTDILVATFVLPVGTNGSSGSGTFNIPGQANFPITPATQRDVITGSFLGEVLVLEQTVINTPQLLIAQLVIGSSLIAAAGIMAVGVVLQGGFALVTPPGFSDIDDTQLIAGSIVHALKLNQISQNASLGMVRPEFFYGTYLDGDTVATPVSPVDQYQYQRDELFYIYTPYTNFDVKSGWTSAAGILFYAQWNVDPNTGTVTVKEFYHPDGNTPTNQTSDGQLIVLTIAQRGNSGTQTGLSMKNPPSIVNTPLSLCGQDLPVTQTLMQTLARNSKFGAVKAEVFYMGEFVNGQKVIPPISYVDGYQYAYDECIFLSSWKWTCNPNTFGPPPMATATGAPAHGGWSQLNYMQAHIDSQGNVTCDVHFYNNKDINPADASNGGVAYGRLQVYCFTQRAKGPYFSIPLLAINGNTSGSVTQSYVVKVTNIVGSVTGSLSVSVPASTLGNMPISKIVVLKTAKGGDPVLTSTALYSGGTVTAGTTLITTPVAYTFDSSHDYYFVIVLTNGFLCYQNMSGLINKNTPQNYVVATGDISGDSTISSMSLTPDATRSNAFQAIHLIITGDTVADEFAELPLTDEVAVFVPGNVLTYPYVTQLAQNVKEGAYAVEFFGPTNHVFGDTVPLPTSPTDGYTYSRSELLYIWQWHDTGNPVIRLLAFGASISSAGLVNLFVYHVGDGGPIINNYTGASIDVVTIGVRSHITSQSNNPTSSNNGNPPSDLSSMAFGGVGGFTVNGGS